MHNHRLGLIFHHNLKGRPPRLEDPTIMITITTAQVLICHTSLLMNSLNFPPHVPHDVLHGVHGNHGDIMGVFDRLCTSKKEVSYRHRDLLIAEKEV